MRHQLCFVAIFFIYPVYQSTFKTNRIYTKDANLAVHCMQSFSDTDIVARGATPQLISRQFSFTEGPATDKEGNIFFTDQPNNKIWKYDINGKLSVFLDNTGRSN